MESIAEQSSRTLDAVADLRDFLRLAHESVHRLKQDVHGNCYDSVDIMSFRLHDLRNDADKLSREIEEYVKEIEIQAYG